MRFHRNKSYAEVANECAITSTRLPWAVGDQNLLEIVSRATAEMAMSGLGDGGAGEALASISPSRVRKHPGPYPLDAAGIAPPPELPDRHRGTPGSKNSFLAIHPQILATLRTQTEGREQLGKAHPGEKAENDDEGERGPPAVAK